MEWGRRNCTRTGPATDRQTYPCEQRMPAEQASKASKWIGFHATAAGGDQDGTADDTPTRTAACNVRAANCLVSDERGRTARSELKCRIRSVYARAPRSECRIGSVASRHATLTPRRAHATLASRLDHGVQSRSRPLDTLWRPMARARGVDLAGHLDADLVIVFERRACWFRLFPRSAGHLERSDLDRRVVGRCRRFRWPQVPRPHAGKKGTGYGL